jgi:hypothetical protein
MKMDRGDVIGHRPEREADMLRNLLTLGLIGLNGCVLIGFTYRAYLFGSDGLTIDKVNGFQELGLSHPNSKAQAIVARLAFDYFAARQLIEAAP